MTHKSDSTEQQSAEQYLLAAVERRFGLRFTEGADLGIGVQPDGVDPASKVVVEVYSRLGNLKGSQLHKVKADLLKFAFIAAKLGPTWRKIFRFASPVAASYLQGTSWAAEAARHFGVEIHAEPLPADISNRVSLAQKRQRMVNAP